MITLEQETSNLEVLTGEQRKLGMSELLLNDLYKA